MDRGIRASYGVTDQDGHTISGLNPGKETGQVRHYGVRLFAGSGGRFGITHDLYDVTVHLPNGGEQQIVPEYSQETPSVFLYVFSTILVVAGEVQVVRGEWRDAAEPGRESVYEANVLERSAHKDLHAVIFSPKEPGLG